MQGSLDHRLLRQFVAVARAGGLRAGAAALNMSQPPLSRTIQSLEAGLGVEVFERSKSGTTLTYAGKVLLREAEEILAALDRAEARVRRLGSQARPLRIGFVSAALDAHLPTVMARITDRGWPTPELVEMPSTAQVQALQEARLDLGLLHPPVESVAGLSLVSLGEEGFLVALKTGHPLCILDAIRTSDLAGQPLVLFPKAQGPVLHAAITDVLARDGRFVVGAEAARSHTQLALVAAGAGIGLIGASVARALNYNGVVLRPWVNRPSQIALHSAVMGPTALLQDLGYL